MVGPGLPPMALVRPGLTQAQVDGFKNGLNGTLGAVQTNLVSQVFGKSLPLLGDNFRAAAEGGAAQLNHVTTLKNAVIGGLNSLSGAEEYTEAQVVTALNSALGC